MKFFASLLVLCVFLGACDGRTAENAASKVTKKTVELGKGAVTGVVKGVDEGRVATTGPDGAVIVPDRISLEKLVTMKIMAVRAGTQADTTEVDIGFGNSNTHPVRVTNLTARGQVLALDKEKYTTELTTLLGEDSEVTIPADAKVKRTFVFAGPPARVATVRIFGMDVPPAAP